MDAYCNLGQLCVPSNRRFVDSISYGMSIDDHTTLFVCVYLTTVVWKIFAYKNFRVKNFSDIVYLSRKFFKAKF